MNELKLVDDRKSGSTKIIRPPMSPKLRYEILKRDGFKCQNCGRTSGDGETVLEVDHIIPVSKGGTHDRGNLLTLCRECNRGKSDDELLNQESNVKVVEKIVIKEVPIEKIIYKEIPTTKPYTLDYNNLKFSVGVEEFLSQSPSVPQILNYIETEAHKKAILEKGTHMSKDFAINEIETNGGNIYKWANQSDDVLLKQLAIEVIATANEPTKENNIIKMKCNRKDCNHEWDYKGTRRFPKQVCCPGCGNKVRVPKEETK